MNPTVTVVITTRNRKQLVAGALECIYRQTRAPEAVIVVNDASTDGTKAWLDAQKGLRPGLEVIHHQEQEGLAAARNAALTQTKTEWVAFMDDDDGWHPDKIARQLELVSSLDELPVLVYCGFSAGPEDTGPMISLSSKRGPMSDFFSGGDPGIPSSSCMIRHVDALAVGGFSTGLRSCIDHDFFLKLAFAGFHMIPVAEKLAFNRQRDRDNMMTRFEERLEGIDQFFQKWRQRVTVEWGRKAWIAIEAVYHKQTTRNLWKHKQLGLLSAKDYWRHGYGLCRVQKERKWLKFPEWSWCCLGLPPFAVISDKFRPYRDRAVGRLRRYFNQSARK